MYTSAITSKGQVTIPKEIRKQLQLKVGDKVGFIIEQNQVKIIRKPKDIEANFGVLTAKRGVSLEKMDQVIKKRGKGDLG